MTRLERIEQNACKDELTTEMHKDFQVSEFIEERNSVWILLSECDRRNKKPEDLVKVYGLTIAQIEKHRKSYLENK